MTSHGEEINGAGEGNYVSSGASDVIVAELVTS